MTLGDFSSVFEVGVGLNLAFVAAEYASSYTNILAKYVYKLYEKIDKEFDSCSSIVNSSAVEDLRGNVVDGRNTVVQVEELKIKHRNCLEKLEGKKRELLADVDDKCHFRCFAFISLYLFLYSVLALFLSGYHEYNLSTDVWNVFSAATVTFIGVYALLVRLHWFKGYTTSLISSIVSFVLLLLLSFVAVVVLCDKGIMTKEISTEWLKYTIPVSTFMPYANFVTFVFIMSVRSKKLYKRAIDVVAELKPDWESMKQMVSDLGAVNRVSSDLMRGESLRS